MLCTAARLAPAAAAHMPQPCLEPAAVPAPAPQPCCELEHACRLMTCIQPALVAGFHCAMLAPNSIFFQ